MMTAIMHGVSAMEAERGGNAAWLRIAARDGSAFTIFMDFDMASEIADLWEAMNREPEPPTFDEALAAKFGREALNDEAMRVKGMVE
jgi:hypothetical protein